MENTIRDFWKMVVDQSVPAVVMLCNLKEDNVSRPYNDVIANKINEMILTDPVSVLA